MQFVLKNFENVPDFMDDLLIKYFWNNIKPSIYA